MNIYSNEDLEQLEKYHRISLLNKISGLKSANLIATKSKEGQSNVAIFNSVVHIGANPPFIGFVLRPLTVERQTYDYIKETGYYTINAVTTAMHQRAHQTSAKYPSDMSEFEACDLSEEYYDGMSVPYVKESPIKIGLSFQEEQRIKANGTILMIGKVEQLIIADDIVFDDGDIDFEALDGVSIGGLDTYYSVKRLGKYPYARVEK